MQALHTNHNLLDSFVLFPTRWAGNLELSTVLYKPGVDENIALHAFHAVRNSSFPVSAFLVRSTTFFLILFQHKVTCNLQGESEFDL